MINGTLGEALRVVTEERTAEEEFAAGAATGTVAGTPGESGFNAPRAEASHEKAAHFARELAEKPPRPAYRSR